ncbi:hypothetical protein JTB14_012510 [Gonioctena quinquepunctata]|nr:hypothetical protein JTB14_012510 [Gonioctena quinquepunctata]
MIGGVCVAMFMVGVIVVLLAVTISKLRKRDEHSNSVHPVTDVVLQTIPTDTQISNQVTPPQALSSEDSGRTLVAKWRHLVRRKPPPRSLHHPSEVETLTQANSRSLAELSSIGHRARPMGFGSGLLGGLP